MVDPSGSPLASESIYSHAHELLITQKHSLSTVVESPDSVEVELSDAVGKESPPGEVRLLALVESVVLNGETVVFTWGVAVRSVVVEASSV